MGVRGKGMAFESPCPAQHTVPPERMLRRPPGDSTTDITLQAENVPVAFRGENVSDSEGFGSRCYESGRPTRDVYFQSFEQRERFVSPTNTQNSSGGTTTQL